MQNRQYSSRELLIFLWCMIPYTMAINIMLFGTGLFQRVHLFVPVLLIGIGYFAFVYFLFGMVAGIIKKRYPEAGDFFRRIAIMLPIFYFMNLITIQGIYFVLEWLEPASTLPRRNMEWWVTGFACVASTVITLLNEAAAGWEKWKTSVTETEQLKYAYQKTRLLGLKGQVNPHFLFNCFNSLSSLINEDEAAAEKFLDEMTKVHRYMLRSDDEPVTTLRSELQFACSYLYLIKQRFGEAITTSITSEEKDKNSLLPPLSLQVILENIIYNNAASRQAPLHITFRCNGEMLSVTHTVHLKTGSLKTDEEEGLDNLIKKYELLNAGTVTITETDHERTISLPFIQQEIQ